MASPTPTPSAGSTGPAIARPIPTRRLWTEHGVRDDTTVLLDEDGRVLALRDRRATDGPAVAGLVVPGLINAHAHLELSDLAGRVPGGRGLLPWVRALMNTPRQPNARAMAERAARAAVDAGTAWLLDISNAGDTAELSLAAGLAGRTLHELLGMSPEAIQAGIQRAGRWRSDPADGTTRTTPHALFSTHPELVLAAISGGAAGSLVSIHVGESDDERTFLRDGSGPCAQLLDDLGRDWRRWQPPGMSPFELLERLGVLGPRLLLVHGVFASPQDRRLVARSGSPLCLCPRSNLHISGRLPDVIAWIEASVPLCVGTDSLASTPDLDVLGEVAALATAFPQVPGATWLTMVTHGAAQALGISEHGLIGVGRRPGLLELDMGDPAALARAPSRRWLVPPPRDLR